MSGMDKKEFDKLERIVDRLLASGLSEKQLEDVNSIIRISYKHIHKSNDLVERTTMKMEAMNAGMEKIELLLSPISSTSH